ncbi:MAG: hypothetical protein HQ506_06225 [Candidatus Marinimicrobia bacterium]|nr:hypothetical protein [Candidatus Neomarinimicrobiota bacterium]
MTQIAVHGMMTGLERKQGLIMTPKALAYIPAFRGMAGFTMVAPIVLVDILMAICTIDSLD